MYFVVDFDTVLCGTRAAFVSILRNQNNHTFKMQWLATNSNDMTISTWMSFSSFIDVRPTAFWAIRSTCAVDNFVCPFNTTLSIS